MSSITPLFRLLALAWWRWARTELQQRDPMHPDLPTVVLTINRLESRQ